jgi:flavin reductase (DIM6/NTAB) family NADH-FMN oxidoreductase RutF
MQPSSQPAAARISALRASDAPAARTLRTCLGRFVTGVTVVTFEGQEGRRGLTINSFSSVSMRPPLIMISVAKTAQAHDELRGRRFCVNVLGAEQEAVARHFAGGGTSAPLWADDPAAPRLAGTLAHLICEPWGAYDGGDHTIFLGEVIEFEYRSGDALAYANSRFTPVTEPVLGHEYLL